MTKTTAQTPATELTWQDRLQTEANELKEKISKLTDFIANPAWLNVDSAQKDLIARQYTFMELYQGVLLERLALLAPVAETKE